MYIEYIELHMRLSLVFALLYFTFLSLPYSMHLLTLYLIDTYDRSKEGKGEKTVRTEVANRDQMKKRNWDLFVFFLI